MLLGNLSTQFTSHHTTTNTDRTHVLFCHPLSCFVQRLIKYFNFKTGIYQEVWADWTCGKHKALNLITFITQTRFRDKTGSEKVKMYVGRVGDHLGTELHSNTYHHQHQQKHYFLLTSQTIFNCLPHSRLQRKCRQTNRLLQLLLIAPHVKENLIDLAKQH
jgi:hypothetical protein